MPLEPDIRDQILSACKGEQFARAADLLVGDTKNSVTYEEVLATFQQIGQKITVPVLENISNIYQKNLGNLAMLKSKLHNVASSYSMVSSGQSPTEMNMEEVKGQDLENSIVALRKKQKQVIAKTGRPDQKIAQQLNTMLTKKQNLDDKDYGEAFQKKDVDVEGTPPPGAKNWFVLPEASELNKYEDMSVVVGAPIIDVLRERYESHYNTTIHDEIRHSTKLTAEQQFQRKKELDRERAFVESYKDTSMVEDQDIFVHQVASQFITDQYDIVEPKSDQQEGQLRNYNFADGKLIDSFDRDSRRHSLRIEGSIPGAFTVSIKRRTDSGRIIDDVYDIVEFRDGRAVNYAYSSKGNVSLNSDDVKRSISQAKITLERPRSSRMFGEEPLEEVKEVEKPEEQTILPPVPKQKDELPPLPKEKPESPAEERVVEKEPDDKEAKYDKGFLESQLRAAVAGNKTSKTTIKYLVDQLASAEGRKSEDIAKEFGIKDLPKSPVKKKDPVAVKPPVQKLKAQPKKPKKRKKKEKNNSEELKLIKQELKKTFDPNAFKKSNTKKKPKSKTKPSGRRAN